MLVFAFYSLTGRQPLALAQTGSQPVAPSVASLDLPDAPGFSSADSGTSSSAVEDGAAAFDPQFLPTGSRRRRRLATRGDITIQPGQTAPFLRPHDKFVLGLEQSFTLFSAIGWVASAGYTQLVNGSPNYGTDSGAFGVRLGATAIRSISQNILGNAIFAPPLHEDPRYYRMGPGHNPLDRAVYAATRTLITKNDSGSARPNISLLGGHLAGAALTNLYYPQSNQGLDQTAKTFGTAIGGAAIGFVVTEFLDDALRVAHLQKFE